jgi:hypothetical protein
MRVTLLRTADDDHRLIWTTHHLLVDGWSWPLIFEELSALYSDEAAVLPPVCPYREYIEFLQQHDWTRDERFWRDALTSVVDRTPIPSLPPERDEHRETDSDVIRRLSAATTSDLAAVARTHQVTLGTIVSAAWSLVLAHHSGRSDVVFGASFAGRPDGLPGVETMVGPCVNNLPIVACVNRRSRAGQWLRGLHHQIGELTQYQAMPLTEIHACSALPTWMRLFDSLVVVQNYIVDSRALSLGSVRVRPLRCPESTNYPITIVVRPGAELNIKIMRSGERVSRAAAVAVADDLAVVLKAFADLGDVTLATMLARLPDQSRGVAGSAAAERRLRRGPRLAPRTDMERVLMEVWRELFDGDIGTDENYFELGVHSRTTSSSGSIR